MKYIQSAIVIAALLGGSEAVNLGQLNSQFQGMPISIAQVYQKSFAEYEGQLKGKSEAELFALVEEKVKAAKKEEPAKEAKQEEAVAKDAEAKAIEKIVAQKLYDRVAGGYGYGYPYGYYPGYWPPYAYTPDVASRVAAIAAYHDVIVRQEAANAIAGLVAPSAEVVLGLLEGATKGKDDKKEAKPAEKSALQLSAEGVPVLIEPTLAVNEVADADLR